MDLGSERPGAGQNDITNAFAAAYRDDNSLVLAFGADRHAVNGDAQMGFWFNQAPMCLSGPGGTCPATTPNQANTVGKFVDPDTGALAEHQGGDVLPSSPSTTAATSAASRSISGTTRRTSRIRSVSTIGQDCTNTSYPANFCTSSNKVNLPGEPFWPYNAKGGGADDDYETSAFIEGFIDLGSIAGAGTCFRASWPRPGRRPVHPRSVARRNAEGLRAEELPALRIEPRYDAEGRRWSGNPCRWPLDHDGRIDLGQGRGSGHRLRDRDVERNRQVLALRSSECGHGNV